VATTLDDLREQLFETLKDLRAKDKPMDIDRAKAISDVAQTFINSAKAEVDFVRATGMDSADLPVFSAKKALPAPGQPRLVKGAAQSGSKE
jgi:hypothetical protein